MSNFEIYRRTLPIALARMLFSFLVLIVSVALPVAVFLATRGMSETACIVSTCVGVVLGIVLLCLVGRYLGYLFTAGQVAMITKGVTEGELPEHIVRAGKDAVKGRFAAASVYFALHSAIRSITDQLTKGLTAAGAAIGSIGGEAGKNAGGGIGAAIGGIIAVVLEYVNFCCLGWVFRNPNQGAFQSTCDGAVLYFQNWKALLKNAAKILGITLLSLVVIGIPLVVLSQSLIAPLQGIGALLTYVAEAAETDTEVALWIVSAALGLIGWGIVHSALVKPFLLVSVLRGYMEAADENPPKVDLYEKLCGISRKFKKTLEKARGEGYAPSER